jgi:hypothetical protein
MGHSFDLDRLQSEMEDFLEGESNIDSPDLKFDVDFSSIIEIKLETKPIKVKNFEKEELKSKEINIGKSRRKKGCQSII